VEIIREVTEIDVGGIVVAILFFNLLLFFDSDAFHKISIKLFSLSNLNQIQIIK
jgi:hypothetical protein